MHKMTTTQQTFTNGIVVSRYVDGDETMFSINIPSSLKDVQSKLFVLLDSLESTKDTQLVKGADGSFSFNIVGTTKNCRRLANWTKENKFQISKTTRKPVVQKTEVSTQHILTSESKGGMREIDYETMTKKQVEQERPVEVSQPQFEMIRPITKRVEQEPELTRAEVALRREQPKPRREPSEPRREPSEHRREQPELSREQSALRREQPEQQFEELRQNELRDRYHDAKKQEYSDSEADEDDIFPDYFDDSRELTRRGRDTREIRDDRSERSRDDRSVMSERSYGRRYQKDDNVFRGGERLNIPDDRSTTSSVGYSRQYHKKLEERVESLNSEIAELKRHLIGQHRK